jgi:hypothetical protein
MLIRATRKLWAAMRRPLAIWLCALCLGAGACAGEGSDSMQEVRHISVSIARPPDEVYEFASDPRNLPRWDGSRTRRSAKCG